MAVSAEARKEKSKDVRDRNSPVRPSVELRGSELHGNKQKRLNRDFVLDLESRRKMRPKCFWLTGTEGG